MSIATLLNHKKSNDMPAVLVLYDEGDTYSSVTGGWVERLVNTVSGSQGTTPVNYDGHVTMHLRTRAQSGKNSAASMYTSNMINVSRYSTLHMKGFSTGLNNSSQTITTGVAMGFFGLYDRTDPDITTGSSAGTGIISWKQISAYNQWVETALDISSITGSYYIGPVQRAGDASFRNLYMTKMWLD